MELKNIKAVILDLDDTLLVEEESAWYCLAKTIEKYTNWEFDKANLSVDKLRAMAKKRWYALPTYKKAQELHISSWEALWADFNPSEPHSGIFATIEKEYQNNVWLDFFISLGIKDTSLAQNAMRYNKNLRKNHHILFPDAIDFIQNLHPYFPLAMITNGTGETQWCKINGSGLNKYFKHIYIAGELGFGKPDPRIYTKLAATLKIKTKNCLMIGNSLTNDIKGAMDTGMKAIWINRKDKKPEITDEYNFISFSSLEKLWRWMKPQL